MHAGIQHANVILRSKMAGIAFTVEVEHAGKSTVIAGGLTETLAHATRTEATRRLPGFQ